MVLQRINVVLVLLVGLVALWLFRSATSACDPRDLALIRTEGTFATFERADADGDGRLSVAEFAIAAAELRAGFATGSSAQQSIPVRPPQLRGDPLPAATATAEPNAPVSVSVAVPAARAGGAPLVERVDAGGGVAAAAASGAAAPEPAATAAGAPEPMPPKCSILIFWHLVKTAGTTMRTVLQRQAQIGEFEYVYSDTLLKPRWQLIMHQLSSRVAHRRIILELHSEWGLPKSFFADVAQLRQMYEPLGCRVTLGTVLRQPIAWYLSMFNWRASNTIPLCQWQPPRDGISRQITGFSLPFTQPGPRDRDKWNEPGTVVSVLEHFDVVGLTERFDESLLLLAERAGLSHRGYSKLAANNKPQHPAKAKALLKALLAQLGLSTSDPFLLKSNPDGMTAATVAGGVEAVRSGDALGSWGRAEWEAHLQAEADAPWGDEVLQAMSALNEVSMAYVERRGGREKADCNFYPCEPALKATSGVWSRELCPETPGGAGSAGVLLKKMLNRTAADRAVHAYVVRRLNRELAALGRRRPVPALLQSIDEQSHAMAARRLEAVGPNGRKLCGVRLCDANARRSCVKCPPDPVPALESCWPSWEDQFSPDEQKWWCKRSWTIAGYDAAEMKARNYPKIAPPGWAQIPCWQTCWEAMKPSVDTCLATDAPKPDEGTPGASCSSELHCSPTCAPPLFPSLPEFWEDWQKKKERMLGKGFTRLNISGTLGHGG